MFTKVEIFFFSRGQFGVSLCPLLLWFRRRGRLVPTTTFASKNPHRNHHNNLSIRRNLGKMLCCNRNNRTPWKYRRLQRDNWRRVWCFFSIFDFVIKLENQPEQQSRNPNNELNRFESQNCNINTSLWKGKENRSGKLREERVERSFSQKKLFFFVGKQKYSFFISTLQKVQFEELFEFFYC